MSEEWRISKRATMMKSSIIRETLKLTQKPGIISFGGGLPAPELFPVAELREAVDRMLVEKGRRALQYGTTEGYRKLREFLADRLKKKGIDADPELIMITGGSQQGLDLCGRVFLNDGDAVLTSNPTYLGAIQAFNAYYPRYITLESDDNGMTVDGMEDLLKEHNPRFIYLVPTFQNPDGRTLPLERRKYIIDLAQKYNIPIIEDDPYSDLCYEGEIPPNMVALDKENVIMLGTFSKLISPGLRIAWVLAPAKIYDKFVKMKQGADLHTNTFCQFLIYEYAKHGALEKHLDKVRRVYYARMKAMLSAMEKYFPDAVKWTKPTGGMFLWVELPDGLDARELLKKAVERDVAYIPGTAFYPDGTGENTMRLNYSKPTEEEIEEGIKRLAEVIKEAMAKLA